MSWFRRHQQQHHEAEDLDVTPIMNLMIVLVPILSLTMVFTHIRVLNLQLPELVERVNAVSEPQNQSLEVLITPDELAIYYPADQLLKNFPRANRDTPYAYAEFNAYLQQMKTTFAQQKLDKRDIVLRPTADVAYQTLVSVMDHVSQYRTLVATSVVRAELFSQIRFADAPANLRVKEGN
jgi:hypothetical protein